jgi:light-regulated signal transduction histidine kinase (bacteriophytochrome)
MERLIEDLLVFSRMGHADLRYSAVHLHQMVEDVLRELRHDVHDRHIEWIVHSAPSAW